MLSRSVFTAYWHSNCGDVSSFSKEIFIFCGFFTVVFFVINSGVVFRLSVSGNVRFFPAVQTLSKFGSFLKINGNI